MTANRRILQRLLDEVHRFEAGSVSLPDLQRAILGHGLAAELGQHWRNLINQVEGEIEVARFTVEPAKQLAAVRPHLDRLRRAASDALRAEPDEPLG